MGNIWSKAIGSDGFIGKLISFRNNYIISFEVIFLVQNIVLVVLAWVLLLTGVKFLSSEKISKQGFGFDSLRGGISFMLVWYTMFLNFMGIMGGYISYRKSSQTSMIFFWGIGIFFFACVPLYSEGVEILKFVNIEDQKIKQMCPFNGNQTDFNLEDQPKWVLQFVLSAQRFDMMSEVLLDEYMCTDTCPCLEYNEKTQYNNPQFIYERVLEPKLRQHRRTNADKSFADKNGLISFNWTTDESKGFKTFKDCYQYYAVPHSVDPSKPQINEVFKFSKTIQQGSEFANDPKGKSSKMSLSYFLSHMDEVGVYQMFEDQYDCSGICRPGLFYFGQKLDRGPPQETCLMHFKHALQQEAKPFADISIILATLSLFIYLSSFTMMLRPVPDDINIERQYNQDQGIQQLPQGSFQADHMPGQIQNDNQVEFSDIRPDGEK